MDGSRISDEEAPAPPHDQQIEGLLLGAIFYKPSLIEEISSYVRPEHFYFDLHNMIYTTMLQLAGERKPCDPQSVFSLMQGYSMLEDAGGMQYFVRLMKSVPVALPSTIRGYADIIVDYSMRRDMIEHAAALMVQCRKPLADKPAREILERHEQKLLKLAQHGETGGLVQFGNVMNATISEWERQHKGELGTPTGFEELDRALGGLFPGDVYVLAGATGMGKSAFATNVAFNTAQFFQQSEDLLFKGKQVAFFSLEMTAAQLGGRVITGQTAIASPRNRWRSPMDAEDWAKAMEAASRFGKMPFWIDDSGEQTLSRIRARLIRLHRRKPVGGILIDYVQLIMGEKGGDNKRIEQLSYITRGIKRLAKEIGAWVIELAQISRSIEQREDKRPILADLRESGTIEQDADSVLFVYRPQYYLERESPQRKANERQETFIERCTAHQAALADAHNKADIIIAKNRHGETKTVRIDYDPKRTWFANSRPPEPPPQPDFDF